MKRLSVLFLLLALVVAAPVLQARGKKQTSKEPGKYQKWGPDIDELEVVKSFKAADYTKIVVEPFDTKDTPLPEEKDNTYAPVKQVLADPNPAFVEGLSKEAKMTVTSADKAPKSAGTLIVRAKVTTMDPGSKAARYWAGFGAGAARTEIQGEIVDAKTGAVLLRFTQERRSGIGTMGGDYVALMNRNLRALGKDVADILAEF